MLNEHFQPEECRGILCDGSFAALVLRINEITSYLTHSVQPFTVGASLAGAGGGGFLAAVLRAGADRAAAVAAVRGLAGTERLTFHTATVDTEGLAVTLGGTSLEVPP